MTSVVLVDDQQLVRDGLRLILELAGIDVVGEAADGAEGADLVLERRPDVALLDLRMPGTDGVEATRRITSTGSATRVVVLTTFEGEEHTFRALQAGPSGYLLKDAGGARIVEAVQAAAAGEMPLAPSVVARPVDSYVRRPPAPSAERVSALSDREREVLGAGGRRAVECRDRRGPRRLRGDGQDPPPAHPGQARTARPRAGDRAGARVRARGVTARLRA